MNLKFLAIYRKKVGTVNELQNYFSNMSVLVHGLVVLHCTWQYFEAGIHEVGEELNEI